MKLLDGWKAEGKTKEQALVLLDKARAKLGLSGGSFMERASSMAQVAPTPPEATVEKAGLIKENMPEINQDIGEDSARKEMMAKAMTPGFLKPLPGIAQGLAKAASGGASLYEKGLQKVTGITPEYAGGAETAGEVVKESKALEADTTEEKVGQFIGEYVVPAVVGGGLASAAVKTAGLTGKTGVLANFLASSTGGTAGYTVAGKGSLPTAKELGIGMAVDLMTLGLGKIATKLAPQVFRVGANPAGKNYIDIEDKASGAIGKYVGTKKQIVNQANDVITQASSKMDDLLKDSTAAYTRKDLAEGAIEAANALEKGNPVQAAQITEYADEWVTKAKTQELTAAELRTVKSQLGEMLSNVFSKDRAGDPKIAAQGQALLGIWGKIDEILDGVSPEVSKLNKEMNIAYSIKQPLELALEKPFLQSFLSMLNPKNIPGTTPITSVAATGLQKLEGLLTLPGIPEAAKAVILEVLSESLRDNQ